MLKNGLRDRKLLILFLIAVAIKLFSLNSAWVERYYTYGFYPCISLLLRTLFGWIPFSLGDIAYAAAGVLLVVKVGKAVRLLAAQRMAGHLSGILMRKYLKLVLWIYIVFNVFWGLNYNRQGIAGQLGLSVRPYTHEELYQLSAALQQKLNAYAAQTDSAVRLGLDKNQTLFREGVKAYKQVVRSYPFLRYRMSSIKASLYSGVGEYFGFTGYYNPFSGEAQLKTSVPVFVKPFIICHEMAHQIGYGKENEANLVAFLAGRASTHPEFRYSAYYDVYSYAISELAANDSTLAAPLRTGEAPRYKIDRQAYRAYLLKSSNGVEPYVSGFYDRYLKLNNQPNGKTTYNEVVAWLVAYMKKYGTAGL